MSKMDVTKESCALMRVGRFHTCGHNCNEYSKSTLKLPSLRGRRKKGRGRGEGEREKGRERLL